MFKLRLFSGILLLVATVATLYFGGVVTFAVLTMISLIGVNELLRIFQMEKSAMAVIVYCATILYYLMLLFNVGNWGFTFLIAVSKISCTSADGILFQPYLCQHYDVLHLSAANSSKWRRICSIDFPCGLGNGYLCLLYRNVNWKA